MSVTKEFTCDVCKELIAEEDRAISIQPLVRGQPGCILIGCRDSYPVHICRGCAEQIAGFVKPSPPQREQNE